MTDPQTAMPALFLGHGSPMNAIEDTSYRRGWAAMARRFQRPRAVLCVSAHWETRGVQVTGAALPEIIHDFIGFPARLYQASYPAPGDATLAGRIAGAIRSTEVSVDPERGLDHGAWSVLSAMYPEADVPVVQISLDTSRPGSFHVALARELIPFREQGILVLGSGNLVHNLRLIQWDLAGGTEWAVRFDALVRDRIRRDDLPALADVPGLGPDAALAVPTPEHYLPLLYALALRRKEDPIAFFNEEITMGSISMTCVAVGLAKDLDAPEKSG